MYKVLITKHGDRVLDSRPAIVTIGNFDGLHLGHQKLLSVLNHEGRLNNLRRIVVTFEPTPLTYLTRNNPNSRIYRLSLLRDKFMYLRNLNLADELVILHFNQALANLTPQEFINQILQKELNTKQVVVGHDFKFGHGGVGRVTDFADYQIAATVVAPYLYEGVRVSSSLIRDLARVNDLEKVHKYLGHNLCFTSRVIHGNQLGRKYGVPTINLCLGKNSPALWGIYVAWVWIDGVRYKAVSSIGKNPTVSKVDSYKLEAHLLDIDLDLYGKIATVEILYFLRNEIRFDDLESLFVQIRQDVVNARDYFFKMTEKVK